ncbi:hypothetical protein K1719_036730 [Acacia pycnantha]|nr:hypothetical protein K1719_036730 [Acacia pycnantha]
MSKKVRGERLDGDGRERGDGDGGGGCKDQTVGSKGDDRRPVSISYREKLLSPGGLGFLVSHEEADDIVSGWKGFFAKECFESEMKKGGDAEAGSDEEMGGASGGLGFVGARHVLIDRVRRMWKPKQPLKVVPLSNEYYIVSFSSKEDRDYAYYEGPWMIDDHYLLVQRWRPNFNPKKADCQRRVAVWVRIPDLPLEFCTVESLGIIGNMIGKMIKIDRSTSIYDKGAFARICEEVDLHKPLLPSFYGDEARKGGPEDSGSNTLVENNSGIGVGVDGGWNTVESGKAKVVAGESRTVVESTPINATGSSGGGNHLGPQMIFRRDWRKSADGVAGYKGVAKIGGVAKNGEVAKKGA